MQEFGIDYFVGVFDMRMTKIYERLGASPTLLGISGDTKDAIGIGLWEFDADAFDRLCTKGHLSQSTLQLDFEASSLGGEFRQTHVGAMHGMPAPKPTSALR